MKSPKYIELTLTLICVMALPTITLAHGDTERGPASAVFHLDPDDDPIVGQVSTVHVLVSHGDEVLELNKCSCSIQLINGDKALGDFPLVASETPDIWTGSAEMTFPERGTYMLVLKGSPVEVGQFESFTLRNAVSVKRTSTDQVASAHHLKSGVHSFHYLLPGMAVAYLCFALIQRALQRRRTPAD